MQGSLMGRRLDLLQVSRHHVFSDKILTQLPPEALGRLQATCTRLQRHIKDLPEAIWVQAASSQLPACHPVFSTSRTVQEYLRLHYDVHKTFSPSQTPAALAQSVSLSWDKAMSYPSPDLSKAAHVEGQQVILTDLTTMQTLGVWHLSAEPQSKWDTVDNHSLHFSPSGKHVFIDMSYARMLANLPSRAICYILDIEAGTVTAPQGPFFEFWFHSWAPSGQYVWVVEQHGDPVTGLYQARMYDTSSRCTAQAQLANGPGPRHSGWAPDSTAVFLDHFSLTGPQLWNLSGESVGVKQGVWPLPASRAQEIHWSPDSTLLYCTTFQSKQLLCYNRQASLVQSCMLSASNVRICLGLSAQPRLGVTTAAIVKHGSYSCSGSNITVCMLGLGCSPAALFSVPLPDDSTCSHLCLSPDGAYLAFILRCQHPDFGYDDGPDDTHALHVCSFRTSIVRVLKLKFMPRSLSWAADGAALLVPGYGQGLICRLV